jgi:ribosomal subunit interface protein
MQVNTDTKHVTLTPVLRTLVAKRVKRLQKYRPDLAEPAAVLKLVLELDEPRKLFRVALTLEVPGHEVPGRTLAAHHERHRAEEAINAAFEDIEQQLARYKAVETESWEYKRPARRAELRQRKLKAPPGPTPGA